MGRRPVHQWIRSELFQLAAKTKCDVRTVERWLLGQRITDALDRCLRIDAKALGFKHYIALRDEALKGAES